MLSRITRSTIVEGSSDAASPAHLFVLVHGLWGSPSHMLTLEKAIKNSLPEVSKEKIITLKPSSFRFWKTYDGIEKCAERVIADLLYEIETLKGKDSLKVTKISIIGYSLGGLISRNVIGKLYAMGFFEEVKPVFFCTFATPHLGVHFFKRNVFDRLANSMGQFLFGYTGIQLFINDAQSLLLKMSEPDSAFFKGLEEFEVRLLLANIKNDRSVPFFTSYITEYSPFDQIDSVNICYLKNLPSARVGTATVWPKFIDLEKSHRVTNPQEFKGNKQEATSIIRSNRVLRWTIIITAASVLVPFYVPLILCLSFYVSGYSAIKVALLRSLNISQHWNDVRKSVYHGGVIDSQHEKQGESRRQQRTHLEKHETFKGDTSNFTENAMENMLLAEDHYLGDQPQIIVEDDHNDKDNEEEMEQEQNESSDNSESEIHNGGSKSLLASFLKKKNVLDIKTEENDKIVKEYMGLLNLKDYTQFPLFADDSKLPLPEKMHTIVENLNKLDWIKIAVYHDLFNAHDGIIARRGERSNPKGTCTIYFWTSILRNHIREHA